MEVSDYIIKEFDNSKQPSAMIEVSADLLEKDILFCEKTLSKNTAVLAYNMRQKMVYDRTPDYYYIFSENKLKEWCKKRFIEVHQASQPQHYHLYFKKEIIRTPGYLVGNVWHFTSSSCHPLDKWFYTRGIVKLERSYMNTSRGVLTHYSRDRRELDFNELEKLVRGLTFCHSKGLEDEGQRWIEKNRQYDKFIHFINYQPFIS